MGGESSTVGHATNSFVGRERELAELRTAIEGAAEGRGALFLISGEAGVGKTRLADEVSALAMDRGIRPLWGRSWDGGGAPLYWPWIQLLKTLSQPNPSPEVQALTEGREPERSARRVSTAVPIASAASTAAAARASNVIPLARTHAEPEEQRFRLFEAVRSALDAAASAQPVLLVIDDLHDADEPSLLLLRFLARHLRGSRIAVVVTYREHELKRSPVRSRLIGDLMREGQHIGLAGLNPGEIAQFLQMRTGLAPAHSVVRELELSTRGNPLVLDAVVRWMVAHGVQDLQSRDLPVPEGIRGWIENRLEGMSPEAIEILSAAAVIGNEFELWLLKAVTRRTCDEAAELLDEAASAGVVAERAPGRWAFCHALLRNALHDRLGAGDRVRLNRCAGEAIEESHPDDLASYLARLAHHFVCAATMGDAERAIHYCIRAGAAARSAAAPQEAARHWETALGLLGDQPGDRQRRARLLAQFGRLLFESGIDWNRGRQYLEEALQLSHELGLVEVQAEIHRHLGFVFSVATGDQGDLDVNRGISHFQQAEAITPKTSRAAGFICYGMAGAAFMKAQTRQALDYSGRGMALGEQLGDEEVWIQNATYHARELFCLGKLAQCFALLDEGWRRARAAATCG